MKTEKTAASELEVLNLRVSDLSNQVAEKDRQIIEMANMIGRIHANLALSEAHRIASSPRPE
jgi:hypothetical protein